MELLIVNSLMAYAASPSTNAITQMAYPLSLHEYEFVFYATGTGPNSNYKGARCGGSGSSSSYSGSSGSSGYNDSMACYL